MKKLVLICSMMGALTFGLLAASAATSDFSGTWVLDKAKSEGLPRNMENAESVTLVVTQDAKELKVETKIVGGQGGLGGGGRGFGGMIPIATYKLDGSENKVEGQAGTTVFKAKTMSEGKVLELTSVRNLNFQGNEVTIKTVEHWELAEGGKVLKIHRTSETPRGTQESKLTFNKQ